MDFIALDTDVASNLIKRKVPPTLLAKLARYAPCVTFVKLGELTEWAGAALTASVHVVGPLASHTLWLVERVGFDAT